MENMKREKHSLERMLNGQLMLVAVLLAILVLLCLYASYSMVRQSQEANHQLIDLTMQKVDAKLKTTEGLMSQYLLSSQSQMEQIQKENAHKEQQYLKLNNGLQSAFSMDSLVSMIFFYNQYDARMCTWKQGTPSDWVTIYEYEKEMLETDGRGVKCWYSEEINEHRFLIRTMKFQGFCLSVYIKESDLLLDLNGEESVFDEAFFLDKIHEPKLFMNVPQSVLEAVRKRTGDFFETALFSSFSLYGTYSSESQLWLAGAIRNTLIERGILIFLILTLVCMLAMVGCLILYGKFQRKNLILPTQKLIAAMQEAETGNLTVQVKEEGEYQEFIQMERSFNHMVHEIHDLKIAVYEEQLAGKNSELKYLQLQINPHFFLNAMNILYTLVLTRQTELFKELISRLMVHSRFVLKARSQTILLKEELQHIRNFIEIQKIRYHYPIVFDVENEEENEDVHVLPMMLYTFVENSVKYGLSDEKQGVHITLKISRKENLQENGQAFCVFEMNDCGPGYLEDVLKTIQSGKTVTDRRGDEHYGVANVFQQLQILYGDQAKLTCFNGKENGANARICIPITIESEKDKERKEGDEKSNENFAGRR